MVIASVKAFADLKQEIDCMAVYIGLGVAFEKKGNPEDSDVVRLAARNRYLTVSVQIGREEAMRRMKDTKFWKQRYADEEYMQEVRRCLKEDGIRTKGLN